MSNQVNNTSKDSASFGAVCAVFIGYDWCDTVQQYITNYINKQRLQRTAQES
jgi:hypothetical protein